MDQILYWNDVALEANRVSFSESDKREQGGPTLSSRALGIIHLAMHDAFVGTYNAASPANPPLGFGGYLSPLPAAGVNASVDAAIATAAYTSLVALYPKQKLFFDLKYNSLTNIIGNVGAGCEYGASIASAILKDRKDDPNNSDAGYVPHIGRFDHKPDPSNPQGYLAPFYGAKSKLFSASLRHSLFPPPSGANYTTAVKQVRGKGIAPELMGTLPGTFSKRTVDESLIGIYWAYDGANGIGTPPRLYNQVIRKLAENRNNTLAQNARLFALVNVAMADAGILAWEQKYVHNFWRPVVGIREHDTSMGSMSVPGNNINNDCDPLWLPLGAPKSNNDGSKNFTPDFPAYPSGHATFGASAFHIARRFYGIASGNRAADNLFDGFDFVSDEFNGVTRDNDGTIRPCHRRNFPGGLWKMIEENGLSRVYLGVHWSFDAFGDSTLGATPTGIGGVDLGYQIAEDIFNTGMPKSSVGPVM
jgi:hypothetical protein